ncbi:MAG: hypothetical protein J5726_03965 [Treponema sp.]|nr:hypothetical protein [Treponema sp.]
MGASVDLDAPIISVKQMLSGQSRVNSNFETSIYCHKDVTFVGSAEDNLKVTNVRVDIKWAEDADYKFLQNAKLDGNNWTATLSLEKEGACSLKFVAEDRSGNYTVKSAKIVTLFVDNNAPVGDSWYIDRLNNGIQYSLQSLDSLKNIVRLDPELTQPANIDVAQNVEFDVCSAFSDASGINKVTISIFDENGNKVLDNIQNSAGTNYAPRFKITHDALVNARPALANGLHYLQVRFSAEDTVTDPGANKVENTPLSLGWFIWWPESDNPKYSISDLQKDAGGNPFLALNIGDSLSITIFDDDALRDTFSCELTDERPEAQRKVTKTANANERENTLILTAPSTPHQITLKINATAKSGAPLDVTLPVTVSDETIPALIITAPENNQIPSVTGNDKNIHFTGLTLDKSDCKYLDFIWVPDSVAATTSAKKAKAVAWADSIASVQNGHDTLNPTGDVKLTEGSDAFAGMKLWSAKLTDAANDGSGFKKKTFNFNLSLINDFGNEKTDDKYFLIRLIREDGKYSDTDFQLSADNLEPEILHTTPAGNMAIIDKDEDFTIKFSVQKQSGLPLKEVKLWHVKKDGTTEEITISPNNQAEYASGQLFSTSNLNSLIQDPNYPDDPTKKIRSLLPGYAANNENPIYRFYTKDILGNEKTEDLQFIISSKPAINTITSSAPSKNKKGDDILINVSFTKSVTVGADRPKLKLQGITNTDANITNFYADYYMGSGSTTLVFKYTVQEGDSSSGLQVYNHPTNGPLILDNLESLGAHLTLDDNNNLQKKREDDPITIDGTAPVVESISVETAVDAANSVGGVKYLRAGRTVTAKVTVSENVTVQGAPTFNLKCGNQTISLVWQKIVEEGGKPVLYFSKKIESTDPNGAWTYNKATCISNITTVKDDYDNPLENKLTGNADPKWYIDTVSPVTPKIRNAGDTADLTGGKFQNSLSFIVKNPQTDATAKSHEKIQYSTNGGTNWNTGTYTEGTTVTLNSDAMLTARITDYAGNVSPYAAALDIKISTSFPDFTVECTNPDGNYKSGSVLTFKVYFTAPVNIPASSGNSRPYVEFTDGRKAYITPTTAQNGVTSASFTYTTTNTDDFTVSVATGGIHLTGVTDEYGFAQGNKVLAAAYNRPNLHCDSVAPLVTKMEIGGSKGNNIYDSAQARTITLTFNENVELGSGKLYLRQVAGWAIPPVLTASEFNTICSSYPEGKEILSVQENEKDMEDSAWDTTTNEKQNNAGYHGTGQYVGPYKKSSQGIKNDGTPDVSTKYVLDFDMDIWETDTTHYYNKTFVPRTNKATETYSAPTTNPRTANQIRAVLEKVHYHERYMSVTTASINNNVVTLSFPAGLFGDTDLPNGRKWELVIEKGSFMDQTGNKFGAETDGSIKQKDAVQTATGTSGSQTENFGTWARGRSTLAQDETPVVLIKNNTDEYFWSDKAATPVIRVDRYSYGNGIFQSDEDAQESQIAATGVTKPSAYVRVRIDCETEGATITYNYDGTSNILANEPTYDEGNDHHCLNNADGKSSTSYSYVTTTAAVLDSISLTGAGVHTGTIDKTQTIIFAAGNGDYTQSYKGYVKAKATKNGDSGEGKEGVFQTVVRIIDPRPNGGTEHYYSHTEAFSIRGTTGMKGEPTISPFPLRDNQFFSPFIRHIYRERNHVNNSTSFYWISYEVLVQSSFSGHSSYNNQWIAQWGIMYPGEFTYCTGFRSW